MKFNPTKTNMVLFGRRQAPVGKITVKMNGVELPLRHSLKYLGVEIQRSLSWSRHINERVDMGRKLLYKCKNLVSRRWGLNPEKMSWIYKAIVRPKLTYGALVWGTHIKLSDLKKLEKVQRMALTSIAQPLRSAPTAGLEAMKGWLPLDLLIKKIGLNSFVRIRDTARRSWDYIGRHSKMIGHLELWNQEISKQYPYGFPTEIRKDTMVWMNDDISSNHRLDITSFPLPFSLMHLSYKATQDMVGWLVMTST